MDQQHTISASRRDEVSMLSRCLNRLFPAQESREFSQLLMDIDEAVWQRKLSRITLRCA
jgi:hypothetical protein